MNKRIYNISNIKILKFFIFSVLFLLVNSFLVKNLFNIKLDLTSDRLFTVSQNTKEIIKNLNEPINIKLFFSNSLSKEIPQIRDYEKRVRELLNKYVNIANGNIKLEIIDPKPFTDQEDLANVYGVQGLQINEEGERFYFGAVISNSVDDTTVIPFFDLSRESFLEYDLTKTIYNLANTSKPNIGLVTSLPFIGGVNNADGRPQYEEPFYLYTRIKEFFNVKDLSTSFSSVPEDIDQLLVIHPKDISDSALYAIDQFIMTGKGVTFFLDPFSEFENNRIQPNNEQLNIPSSNLNKLFSKWGFEIKPGHIVGDIVNGRKVSLGSANDQKIVTYLLWLAIQENLLSKKDIITANLDYIFLKSAGSIDNLNTNNSLELLPLISSSKQSMVLERFKVQFRTDPEELIKNFKSEDKNFIIGARIKGSFNSAFSDDEVKNLIGDTSNHKKNILNANILVFADTDLIADNTWVSKQDMFGRNNITPMSDNGRLVINSLESMSGGENLIGLRGRGVSNRPFLVIEKLQKNAELLFREKELSLQNQLKETETKLNEIKSNNESNSSTAEQNLAIQDFQNRIFSIRKDLRNVQRRLNQDIDNLETNIKLINIWLMPILVLILYFSIRYISGKKRKDFYKRIGRLVIK